MNAEARPPLPPFTHKTALVKLQKAEDAWNSRDPERCAAAYTVDSVWRNRSEFFSGRDAIRAFLSAKWAKELDYRLKKELWAFTGNSSLMPNESSAGLEADAIHHTNERSKPP